jgi:uncharacterized heparinase superfamily protein
VSLIRLFHTMRHLKPVQIYGRALTLFDRPHFDASPAPEVRKLTGAWVEPVARPISLLDRWRVRFLNVEGGIARPEQWNDPARDKLWLYNLHYFDDLGAATSADRRAMQRDLIARWIAENPPPSGNGWEPYPTSLRIANWIKWSLFSGERLEPAWLDSLAQQTRWLTRRLEWRLLGNHLLANAKALVLAGLFFDGDEAGQWLELGLSIYARELPEQTLADGAHFELSPMYHAIILEDLLDVLNGARAYGMEKRGVFADLPEIIARMRPWLAAMTHPDGGPSFFNDAAFGVAARRDQLEAYADRLWLAPAPTPGEGALHLAASGYVRVNWGDATAILDLAAVGPDYLPGHAHADTLSFELSLGNERVIVNGGTSDYAPGPARQAQRETAAHSTVEIDGESSSEVWASFRVARRARVSDVRIQRDGSDLAISGGHDGYRRLAGRPVHRRAWAFSGCSLTVRDEIVCAAAKPAVARFHFPPGVEVEAAADQRSGVIKTGRSRVIRWTTTSPAEIKDSAWHPEFGKAEPAKTLAISFKDGQLTTAFEW